MVTPRGGSAMTGRGAPCSRPAVTAAQLGGPHWVLGPVLFLPLPRAPPKDTRASGTCVRDPSGDLPGAEDPAEHTWVWTPSCPRGGLAGSSHANAHSPCACHGSTREPPTGQRDRYLRASPARPQGAPGLCTGGPGRVSADSATPSRAPPEGAAGSPWGPESTRHSSGAGLRSADLASPPL